MTHVVKTADGGTFEPVLGDKARLLNEHGIRAALAAVPLPLAANG